MDLKTESQLLPVDHIGPGAPRPTPFRWVICGLLFIATTMNYLDRSVLNVISKDLSAKIGWNDRQFGLINTAFTAGYAIGFILMGRLIDRIGTRYGYAAALILWSLASAATAFARNAFGFGVSRLFLGLFEAGNFPAAVRTTAEWFPQTQRATATGIFNAGSNVGAILAPLCVPILVLTWGWQAAFVVTGMAGLAWVALWLPLYRVPSQSRFANNAEKNLIGIDGPNLSTGAVAWRRILPFRQCWCFMAGKFLTDPIWWFYLFWSGKFLGDRFGVNLKAIGPPLIAIYVLADFGSIGGGWLSSTLLKHGYTHNAARKIAMFVCAVCVLPVSLVTVVRGEWTAVLLLGVAAAAHQGFSANMMTLASDMFPKRAVASVSGLGGLAGAIGGMIMQSGSGFVIQATGSYLIPFIVASVAYVFALLVMHAISPTLAPLDLDEQPGFEVVV